MANNKVLVSSDHHANWDALEKLFKVAQDKGIPFIINGDIVGDYNFEDLARKINLDIFEGPINFIDRGHLRKLFGRIVEIHCKKFAELIDNYGVKTYFLAGNHEPIFFADLVRFYLVNENLLINLNTSSNFEDVNGINIAGVSNVNAIMPFIYELFDDEEIDKIFGHQRAPRKIIEEGVSKEKIVDDSCEDDLDYIRLREDIEDDKELDLFFTHGQIGQGAWSNGNFANEMPTLFVAALLSDKSKITIDGHLHSSHEMVNSLGKKTIRAVGNEAYIISKDSGGLISHEKISVDAPYDKRGGLKFEKEEILKLITLEKVV